MALNTVTPNSPDIFINKDEYERFKEYQTNKEYQEFQNYLRLKNDPASSTPNANVLHGLNPSGTLGLFGAPGVDPQMYSTVVQAGGSFEAALPMRPSEFLQVRREIMTGINAETGTNPTGFCGNPMKAGDMKVCQQDYVFGDIYASTQTVDLPNTGFYYNRSDTDRDIMPALGRMSPFAPMLGNIGNTNSQTYKQMVQLATNITRSTSKAGIQGNRTNPHTGTGSLPFFTHQFDGLDRQVRTGYTDAVSGAACSAADSRVYDFSATEITAEDSSLGSIVDAFSDIYVGSTLDLEGMGYSLNFMSHAIVLNPRAWRPLTRVWSCAYQTAGCTVTNGNGERLNVSAAEQKRLGDEMYNGRFLWIDGMRVPVLFSWGVPLNVVGNNHYNSTAYLVPLMIDGSPTLFWEYGNMGNPQQTEFAGLTGGNTRVINNGLYRVGRRDNPMCIEYVFAAKVRLLLTAPFAAARLDNFNFSDNTRIRSPYPAESFYANGGQTVRNTLFNS